MNGTFEAQIAAAEPAHEIPFSIQGDQSQFDISKMDFEVFVGVTPKFKLSGLLTFDLTKAHTVLFRAEIMEWDATAEKVIKTDEILTFRSTTFKATGRISDFGSNGYYEFRLFDLTCLKPFSSTSIYYLVPNSRLQGTTYIKNDRFAYAGRLGDSIGEYEIRIDKLSNKEKKEEREHISHIVEIRKSTSPFTFQEIEEVAYKLQALFSFVDGHWIAPALAYLYVNDLPEMIWLNPRMQWTEPQKIWNWYFDTLRTMDPKLISKAFAFFNEEYNLNLWQQCLTWYFEAMEGDLKKTILANHIGMEMLSWAIVVEMKSNISSNKFDGLNAADKINHLISTIGISNTIPSELIELNRFATANGLRSGPELLTKIRNNLVHPKKKNRDQLDTLDIAAYEEAQQLGIWYMGNCLLFLLKYEGRMLKPFGGGFVYSPLNCVQVNFNQP
jgi:hypothetical protein